jgi:HD-GYP domain-containing protein (c-di-GMP phosphodiesterase class II)
MGLATAQWEMGEQTLAIETMQQTLGMAEIDKVMQAECCEMLSRYYEATGDTAQALMYHRRFYTLEKSIFNQDSQMRVEKLETVYRTRLAEHEMERYRLRAVEMEEKVHEVQLEILERLAMAGEKGADTAAHNRRVCWLAGLVARQLGLSQEEAGAIELASQLHDIGKIAIPDRILGKPSGLTPDEFELVKTHTVIGAEILAQSSIPLLKLAETIALTHHERWDGTGYPKGLRGDEIPLAGRIVAVVDVFDVLISNRPYKQSWMPEVAMAEIRARSGNHFDPRVVEALCNVILVQTI